jgi:hypothetical protein
MPDKLLDQIRTKLGHASLQYTPSLYLDTGIPDLNRVLGHADKGIPYGAIIEVSGIESVGRVRFLCPWLRWLNRMARWSCGGTSSVVGVRIGLVRVG